MKYVVNSSTGLNIICILPSWSQILKMVIPIQLPRFNLAMRVVQTCEICCKLGYRRLRPWLLTTHCIYITLSSLYRLLYTLRYCLLYCLLLVFQHIDLRSCLFETKKMSAQRLCIICTQPSWNWIWHTLHALYPPLAWNSYCIQPGQTPGFGLTTITTHQNLLLA